ncbi:MAG: acyltransferase family protein [Eubacterium sp.]|nr:acyltransferase family protein [Eubacterium sp.]
MQGVNFSKQVRQVSIDLLECIAILLVLIYHSTLYSSDFLSEPTYLHYTRYLFRTLLSPCVSLFFFANGYLLFNKELNLKKHIYKILRLIILCGVWGIGKIVILMPIKNEFLSIKEIIKTLWQWKTGWTNSLWFLGTLVCIYILFPLLKVAYDHNKKVFTYFITACAILTFGNALLNEMATIFLTTILHRSTTLQDLNFFNIFNLFRGIKGYAFVYFCVGGCFYQIKDKILKIKPSKRNILALLIMAASCICLWGVGICYSIASGEQWDVVWNGYDTIFTFMNVICIFVLCLNLKTDKALIRTISCNTLGIYFMHEIFIHLTRDLIKQYQFLCNIPFNIIYAIVILLICLTITLVMRRIPFVRRLVS